MDRKTVCKEAFLHALPIMGSYFFVSMAYGLMMQEAGFGWGWSLLTSLTVYTGAFPKQWGILSYHCPDGIVHEQQTVLLWNNVCRGL